MRVLLAACLLATACKTSFDTPEGAQITCARDADCSDGWSCDLDTLPCTRGGASAPGVSVSPTTVTTSEGETATFGVILSSRPRAPVAIPIVPSDPSLVAVDPQLVY